MFLWRNIAPLQHNLPTKPFNCCLDISTTSSCESNLWKTKQVFSSSFVVYHACFFLISKDSKIAVLKYINTYIYIIYKYLNKYFPKSLFPKVSFLHCCSQSAHLEQGSNGFSWSLCLLWLLNDGELPRRKETVFTYDYQTLVFGKNNAHVPQHLEYKIAMHICREVATVGK